jgi:hypothetical protein
MLTINLTFACLWDFALHRTKITRTQPTHNHPAWPPPPLLLNGNVVHAPPPTRGASTASCALLPAQSTRLLLRRLRPIWLWQVHVRLHLAGIPVALSLMLLGLLAPNVGVAARSMLIRSSTMSLTTSILCKFVLKYMI